jgi:D-alanyl-D-alanine carboxypeptidase/D-alanyl-D-alanine-endopeptidase (penicillin-binding protein 4)
MPRVPIAAAVALVLLALAPAAGAQTALQRKLSRAMAGAGSSSGAYVMDARTGKRLFSRRPTKRRVLASNTKLFTSAALLGKAGPDAMLGTTVVGTGSLRSNGTWKGNLYLRGGGDPTFGSRAFNKGYGSKAHVEAIAKILRRAGFKRVTGHVFGDESLFDSRRGGPESGYASSPWVGPLSALEFNHGLDSGGHFVASPARYAALRLDAALEKRGIKVRRKPGLKRAPGKAKMLAEVRSPTVARLLRLQNKVSDNLFAEQLVKVLPVVRVAGGPMRLAGDERPVPPTPDDPQADPAMPLPGPATTRAGARASMRFARSVGASPKLVDGSGMSRSDRASPRQVARLLDAMRDRPDFDAFYDSLPIAGRDGTLDDRMRSGYARGHCHAKTGTLTNVSALSGYCTTRGGRRVVFSILMNRVNVYGARSIQDRMVQVLARWKG